MCCAARVHIYIRDNISSNKKQITQFMPGSGTSYHEQRFISGQLFVCSMVQGETSIMNCCSLNSLFLFPWGGNQMRSTAGKVVVQRSCSVSLKRIDIHIWTRVNKELCNGGEWAFTSWVLKGLLSCPRATCQKMDCTVDTALSVKPQHFGHKNSQPIFSALYPLIIQCLVHWWTTSGKKWLW